jgi:hypothetical protein
MATPTIAWILDQAGFPGIDQQAQRLIDQGALLGGRIGLTQRMAQRPFHEDDAGHAHGFCQIAGDGNGDSRDSRCFYCTCDQSHGPITESSGRGEEGKIDAVGAQFGRHIRRCFPQEYGQLLPLDVTHQPEMARRNRPDDTFLHQIAEMIERK